MAWYSLYGTGATIHGIHRGEDDRVEFTSWISVLWIPIIPLRSWSGLYIGDLPPNGVIDESHCFADLKRIPHNWRKNARTFFLSVLMAATVVVPVMVLAYRTTGRGATPIEMILVFACTFWGVGLVIWAERYRKKKLRERTWFEEMED